MLGRLVYVWPELIIALTECRVDDPLHEGSPDPGYEWDQQEEGEAAESRGVEGPLANTLDAGFVGEHVAHSG